jgi:hypothetical protein
MSSEFSANAAFLGYFYQARFALLKLLQAEAEKPNRGQACVIAILEHNIGQ